MNDETLKLDIIKAGGYAYPQFNIDPWGHSLVTGGMTLRDRFALAVLQGAAGSPDSAGMSWNLIADHAYRAADAMLAERAK